MSIKKLIIGLAAVLLTLFTFMASFARLETLTLYQPQSGFNDKLLELYDLESVFLTMPDGTQLHGVYHQDSVDVVDLFFHGNAGNISVNEANLKYLTNSGVSYFMIDYPGYGLSEGYPSEESLYESAVLSYEFLRSKKGWNANQIVINGQSLGGAIAIDLASKVPSRALIVESSFPSTYDVAKLLHPNIPIRWVLTNKYISHEKISAVRVPVLFLHGDRDQLLPVEFTKSLYDRAREPKYFILLPGLGHNDVVEYSAHGPEAEKINTFLYNASIP